MITARSVLDTFSHQAAGRLAQAKTLGLAGMTVVAALVAAVASTSLPEGQRLAGWACFFGVMIPALIRLDLAVIVFLLALPSMALASFGGRDFGFFPAELSLCALILAWSVGALGRSGVLLRRTGLAFPVTAAFFLVMGGGMLALIRENALLYRGFLLDAVELLRTMPFVVDTDAKGWPVRRVLIVLESFSAFFLLANVLSERAMLRAGAAATALGITMAGFLAMTGTLATHAPVEADPARALEYIAGYPFAGLGAGGRVPATDVTLMLAQPVPASGTPLRFALEFGLPALALHTAALAMIALYAVRGIMAGGRRSVAVFFSAACWSAVLVAAYFIDAYRDPARGIMFWLACALVYASACPGPRAGQSVRISGRASAWLSVAFVAALALWAGDAYRSARDLSIAEKVYGVHPWHDAAGGRRLASFRGRAYLQYRLRGPTLELALAHTRRGIKRNPVTVEAYWNNRRLDRVRLDNPEGARLILYVPDLWGGGAKPVSASFLIKAVEETASYDIPWDQRDAPIIVRELRWRGGGVSPGWPSEGPSVRSFGVHAVETDPEGRRFVWTRRAAALRVPWPRAGGLAPLIRVGHPDVLRSPVTVRFFVNDHEAGMRRLTDNRWTRADVLLPDSAQRHGVDFLLGVVCDHTYNPSEFEDENTDDRDLGAALGLESIGLNPAEITPR